MKKRILSLLFCVIFVLPLSACGASDKARENTADKNGKTDTSQNSQTIKDENDQSKTESHENKDTATALKDGTFRAESDIESDDGYREYAEVTVKDGKITKINCNAENDKGNLKKDDKTFSGWVDKIAIFENEVITKGIENISLDANGKIADLSGMDLDVSNYASLIKKALEKAKK